MRKIDDHGCLHGQGKLSAHVLNIHFMFRDSVFTQLEILKYILKYKLFMIICMYIIAILSKY